MHQNEEEPGWYSKYPRKEVEQFIHPEAVGLTFEKIQEKVDEINQEPGYFFARPVPEGEPVVLPILEMEPIGVQPEANEYLCSVCNEINTKGLTDEEAKAQFAIEFPGHVFDPDMDLVCQTCWEVMNDD